MGRVRSTRGCHPMYDRERNPDEDGYDEPLTPDTGEDDEAVG